jgi:hypothetical protein
MSILKSNCKTFWVWELSHFFNLGFAGKFLNVFSNRLIKNNQSKSKQIIVKDNVNINNNINEQWQFVNIIKTIEI